MTAQGKDDKVCPSCGVEQLLCTQCRQWIPIKEWRAEGACTFHPGVWCAERPVRQVRSPPATCTSSIPPL